MWVSAKYLLTSQVFLNTRKGREPLPYINTYTYALFSAHTDRNTAKKRKNFGQKPGTESKHAVRGQCTFFVQIWQFSIFQIAWTNSYAVWSECFVNTNWKSESNNSANWAELLPSGDAWSSARCEFLTAVTADINVFWHMTPCALPFTEPSLTVLPDMASHQEAVRLYILTPLYPILSRTVVIYILAGCTSTAGLRYPDAVRLFYRCVHRRNSHGMSWPMQAFGAVMLRCSVRQWN